MDFFRKQNAAFYYTFCEFLTFFVSLGSHGNLWFLAELPLKAVNFQKKKNWDFWRLQIVDKFCQMGCAMSQFFAVGLPKIDVFLELVTMR